MADKSTPRPWKVFTTLDGTKVVGIGELTGDGVVDGGFGIWRDGIEAVANARLIVRAVNRDHLFDEMVNLLSGDEEAPPFLHPLNTLDMLIEAFAKEHEFEGDEDAAATIELINDARQFVKDSRAVLAKVKDEGHG